METLKDILVGVLLVSLVCLCAIYMLSYQGQSSYDFTREQMDAISGETVKYQYVRYLEPSYCLPEFIGVCAGQWGRFGFCTEKGLQTASESFFLFYEKLFTKEGKMEKLSAELGASLFAEAMTGDYLYASYFCDLPKSVICMMAGMDTDGISGESIKEIFIVPDEQLGMTTIEGPLGLTSVSERYTFYAIARDSSGNYYRYTTDYIPKAAEDISFNQNFYFAYSTLEGASVYEFAARYEQDRFLLNNGFSEKTTDTTVIFQSDAPIAVQSYEVLLADHEAMRLSYLETLYINPEKASDYTDENGTRFYFDEGRNVEINTNGLLTYTAPDGAGISLQDLFGAQAGDGDPDIFDCVGAAIVLANKLDAIKAQDTEYTLFISRFSYDGEVLTLSLGYRLHGLPLYIGGSANILSFEFYRGNIRAVRSLLHHVTMTEAKTELPDFLWSVRAALPEIRDKHQFVYAYVVSDGKTEIKPIGRTGK